MKLYDKDLKEGWNDIDSHFSVLIDHGMVIRGIKGKGNSQKTVYPYKKTGDLWTNMSPATAREICAVANSHELGWS